ncbi:MAG: UDP-N-acetylglucosamine 1-carboxyvinyltransferase [Acidobacteria bacterium]|nr:UDP-N-acetylglucosamine 1-carboxyvinyltransferase [Acidobacteriota bacterium]
MKTSSLEAPVINKPANVKFKIQGRRKLEGHYRIQGNKNAALPLISATLLADRPVLLRNLPDIQDVKNLLRVMERLGVGLEESPDGLLIDARKISTLELPSSLVERLRGSVLLLGPLAPRLGQLTSVFPGGCPIGRRSFDVHWSVFRAAGFAIEEGPSKFELRRLKTVQEPRVYLEESSVTATENGLLLLASLGGGIIENPAREPHVFSLIEFLSLLGCEIEVHPLYYRVKSGPNRHQDLVRFTVPSDYIDIGTIAIAAAVTSGTVQLEEACEADILGVRPTLQRFGVEFDQVGIGKFQVRSGGRSNPSQVIAGPWPSFPTDLMSLAIVLATQARGLCLLHDWMYEGRMFFIDKLVRMGARATMCDPHRVLVEGPTLLRGTHLESPDIRAGMALVIAGLCAAGDTLIEHAEVIGRGYEKVAERLQGIGADLTEERS